MNVLDHIPVSFDADEVMRRAGLSGLRDELENDAGELVDAARRLANPKAIYDVCYIEGKTEDSVTIGSGQFTSRVLRINIDGVERVFPYIATCGTELDQLSVDASDILLRYCLDVIKEMTLGTAVTHLQAHLESTYALGQVSRMNPGSLGEWPINQQKQLFAIFGDVEELIGVQLTDSFLMIPTKSVSGIIFPTEVIFQSCQLCPREVCRSRGAPYDPALANKYGILTSA